MGPVLALSAAGDNDDENDDRILLLVVVIPMLPLLAVLGFCVVGAIVRC